MWRWYFGSLHWNNKLSNLRRTWMSWGRVLKGAADKNKRHGICFRLYCLSLDVRTLTIHSYYHAAITCTDIYKSTKTRGLRTNESRSKSGNNIQQKTTEDTSQDKWYRLAHGRNMVTRHGKQKYKEIQTYTRKYNQINTRAHQVNAGNIVIHFYKKLKII